MTREQQHLQVNRLVVLDAGALAFQQCLFAGGLERNT
jgi:hypothetical protein